MKVWIDDVYVGDSWVYGYDVGYGTHSVKVESSFIRDRYKYTFQHWYGGGTSNPRTVNVISDMILRAYYEKTFVNNPPNTPSKPSGCTSGYQYFTYTYSTSTTDPDGDDVVQYKFYWGDDTYTTTTTASASHSWSSTGTYDVKVQAQDEYGLWSGWSDSLAVTMGSSGGDGDPGAPRDIPF